MQRTRRSDTWLLATAVMVAVAATATVIGGPLVGIPFLVVLAVVLALGRRPLAELVRRPTPSGGTTLSPAGRVFQAWWTPIAAAIAVIEVVMGIAIFFTGDNWSGRIIGGLLILPGCGFLTLYGLWVRPRARPLGNTLILVGTLPWFGLFWIVVPPLMGLLVWIGVFRSGFSDPRPNRALA